MKLHELNSLASDRATEELLRCCGSRAWAKRMLESRPFASEAALYSAAEKVWQGLSREDWLEAFSHHPRIGDVSKLREKFAATASWASEEQKGTGAASEATLQALAQGNQEYDRRFGHVFLICATGKSADEMLGALKERLKNTAEEELRIATGEQAKITRIRLEKLLSS